VPVYEYECPEGHRFEVMHSFSSPGPERCEVCAAFPVDRVLHPPAVHFKGSGFYSTDYGRRGKKAPEGKKGSPPETA